MKQKTWIALAVFWSLVIVAATLVPADVVPSGRLGMDKLAHVALFAVFGFLWSNATTRTTRRAALWVLVAGLLFGVTTEILQEVLPGGRTGDPFDGAADLLGVGLGILAAVAFGRFNRERSSGDVSNRS
jgi:VanZ family protein